MLMFLRRIGRLTDGRFLSADTTSLKSGGRRAGGHRGKCTGFQLFPEMNEDLLLRGHQGGEFLNVRCQPGNLVLLPDHAGPEFGDFFRLNSRRRRRLWEDRHLGGHRTLYFLNRLLHSVRLDGTLALNRGVFHRSIRERKGFTNAWMGLVLIARHVGKEVNHLAPT